MCGERNFLLVRQASRSKLPAWESISDAKSKGDIAISLRPKFSRSTNPGCAPAFTPKLLQSRRQARIMLAASVAAAGNVS